MLQIDGEAPALDVPLPRGSAFEADLALFEEKYAAVWRSASTETPKLPFATSRRRRRRNERATDRLVDDVEADLRAWPGDERARAAAGDLLRQRIRAYGRTSLGIPPAQCDVIFSDPYFDATEDFARKARAFDEGLALHDLFQALRNLWIMNLFQLFLDRDLAVTPAMLGYSLLYPYTDNRLDGADLDRTEKVRFCDRLERRLRGEPIEPEGRHERAVFDLVGMIESQHSRRDLPGVYLSLLAIHHAQVASLGQASGGRCPSEDEILAVSIAKGGSSVLADGYLVAGRLDRDEADFFFGYGVVLQLIDDLQDVREDKEAGHRTLFSHRSRGAPLDPLVARLHHFLEAVLDGSVRFSGRRYDVLKDVIRTNCSQLIVQSAAQNPEEFSSPFLSALESYSPVRFRYARKKRTEFLSRYEKLDRRLRREGRLGSLFDAFARGA